MIHDHCDRVFSSCEVMSPFFQGLNDSKELSIVDVIVFFCGGEGVTHSVQKDSRGLLSLDGRYSRRDQRPSSTVD